MAYFDDEMADKLMFAKKNHKNNFFFHIFALINNVDSPLKKH